MYAIRIALYGFARASCLLACLRSVGTGSEMSSALARRARCNGPRPSTHEDSANLFAGDPPCVGRLLPTRPFGLHGAAAPKMPDRALTGIRAGVLNRSRPVPVSRLHPRVG